MPLPYDPEYFQVLEPLLPAFAKRTPLTAENIVATRPVRDAGVAALISRLPTADDIEETVHYAEARDGYKVPVLALVKTKTASAPSPSTPTAAILHFHGGGMVMGSAAMYARQLRPLVSQTGIPLFSVDYRLAPEAKGTTLVEDGFAALQWLRAHARELGVDPARIAVFGQSAGGGLAAGVALLARDRNITPPLAKQILVYPMLDDRTQTPHAEVEPKAFWKTADNVTAWRCVLGEQAGDPAADVSPYVAPARAASVAGLPSTYLDAGTLDIFRDEVIAYAARLLAADVEVDLHVYAGIPHAFEVIAPNIGATKRADANRLAAFLSF